MNAEPSPVGVAWLRGFIFGVITSWVMLIGVTFLHFYATGRALP